jgi:hypothetical protein
MLLTGRLRKTDLGWGKIDCIFHEDDGAAGPQVKFNRFQYQLCCIDAKKKRLPRSEE